MGDLCVYNQIEPTSPTISPTSNTTSNTTICRRAIAQLSFITSGLVLILLNQYLADCGVNSPYAGFGGLAKGGGFLSCAAVWYLFFGARPASFSWKRLSQVASSAYPVATFDIMDTVFATGGIFWAKSGLFVIAFSSITVWVALLRRLCLKQRQAWNKWCSVVLITVAIGASGMQSIDVKQSDKETDVVGLRIVGFASTLVAAFADACMYIYVEKLFKNHENGVVVVVLEEDEQGEEDAASRVREGKEGGVDGMRLLLAETNDGGGDGEGDGDGDDVGDTTKVTPFELLTFIGLVSTAFSLAWMFIFFIGGWWATDVKVIQGCGFQNNINATRGGGHTGGRTAWYTLGGLWILLGVVGNGVHYIAFFHLVKHENSLSASISKASQSAMIFFLSSFLFCSPSSPTQCLTPLKIACAAVVCVSVVLYSVPMQKKEVLYK